MSDEKYEWTDEDISKAMFELGRSTLEGKFNPSTFVGEAVTIDCSDGKSRSIEPAEVKKHLDKAKEKA